jgi:hypothetical protein
MRDRLGRLAQADCCGFIHRFQVPEVTFRLPVIPFSASFDQIVDVGRSSHVFPRSFEQTFLLCFPTPRCRCVLKPSSRTRSQVSLLTHRSV